MHAVQDQAADRDLSEVSDPIYAAEEDLSETLNTLAREILDEAMAKRTLDDTIRDLGANYDPDEIEHLYRVDSKLFHELLALYWKEAKIDLPEVLYGIESELVAAFERHDHLEAGRLICEAMAKYPREYIVRKLWVESEEERQRSAELYEPCPGYAEE